MNKKEEIIALLEYMYERCSNPTYNQLEVGFRHSPLSHKESEQRKNDCLEEMARDCRYLIDLLNKEEL